MFKKDPIMKLLRPTLVGELTGPVLKPDVARMTDITQVAQATFRILKDAGYALGISEMERVYDWSRKTWKRMLIQLLNSLTILVGTVQAERWRPQWSQGSSREGSTGSSQYQSASSAVEGSDTDSDVGLSRLTTERERSDLHKNARTGTWSTNPAPSGIEDTFTGMMRSYAARHATANKPQMPVVPDEDQDESMRSASSRAESDPDRTALIRDPADFFDLGEELVGRPSVAAVATAGTAQPYLTRVRMSAFSELNEFSGRETSEEKFRSWFNRVRSAARRDGMDPAEICTLFGDLMTGPEYEFKKSSAHGSVERSFAWVAPVARVDINSGARMDLPIVMKIVKYPRLPGNDSTPYHNAVATLIRSRPLSPRRRLFGRTTLVVFLDRNDDIFFRSAFSVVAPTNTTSLGAATDWPWRGIC
ncbi:hypothetical protein PF006_g17691 [Phytophthora fragariae]|uniref:Uncharacterized protein n=1 Tax=Phytophthora fragariae TaxID=53985 RepID=A0A6A3SRC6_9STRA|nr:hypothetical protein PF006_g17691 [Phytophthora fragariae]